ncbi:MAG: amidohydrolase family protein [Sediminicola sp.]
MQEIFKGIHYRTGQPIEVQVGDGCITEIRHKEIGIPRNHIAPGLVDLQVNGFKGIDFNGTGLKKEDVVAVTHSLWEAGTTSYYPTLITNSDANITSAIKTIVQACREIIINDSISGIHLEGPFLSKEDGPRGAHPLEHIKAPDWALFCEWQKEAEGRIKLITLSPEWPGSIAFIKQCVASGTTVSIGHTAAAPERIAEAVAAGAKCSTHLGNAAHLMLPRHPNYIWEQLAQEHLWATLIADGFHLPDSVLKVFLKVKSGKSILVSDSTKFAGMPPGPYQSHIGGEIELDDAGRLFLKDSPGLLAGSARSLLECVDHLINRGLARVDEALDMASLKPMELLQKVPVNDLAKNNKADFLLFERNGDKIEIIHTVKSGKIVYSL